MYAAQSLKLISRDPPTTYNTDNIMLYDRQRRQQTSAVSQTLTIMYNNNNKKKYDDVANERFFYQTYIRVENDSPSKLKIMRLFKV